MAEGFLKNLGVDAYSAGIESHGLNPFAIQVMQEINIDISHHYSKTIYDLNLNLFDILITVCDHAKESCPVVTGIETNIHHSFTDPVSTISSDPNKLKVYQKVRDQIHFFCKDFYVKHYSVK